MDTTEKKMYSKPAITTYTSAQLVELVGPAVAVYGTN